MNALDAYRTFIGIKAHFTRLEYNFKKYGKINAKVETFEKRRDRFYFIKLAKEYNDTDIIILFFANLYNNPNVWIGDLVTEESRKLFQERKKIQESLEYSFKNDLDKICDYMEKNHHTFNDLFDKENPIIIKILNQNIITPETYCILDNILNFHIRLIHTRKNDPLWEENWLKLNKFQYFVDISKKTKFKNLTKEKIMQYAVTK